MKEGDEFLWREECPSPPQDPSQALPKPRFKLETLIEAAALPSPGTVLIALDSKGVIHGWDIRTARLLYRLPILGPGEPFRKLTCSPDGRYGAISSRILPAGPVHVFEVATGKEVRVVDRCFSPVFSPDGEVLAGTDGRLIRRWAMKSGAELPTLEAAACELKWAVYSPAGDRIWATSAASASVLVWNLPARTLLLADPVSIGGEPATSLACSSDGKTLAVGSHWGVRFSQRDLRSPPPPAQEEYATGTLRFSQGGQWIMTIAQRRRLIVWDVKTGKRILARAAFRTPEGLLEVSEDGNVVIWVEQGGIRLERIPKLLAGEGSGHNVQEACFTPAGKVATADPEGQIRMWDPATQVELARYTVSLRPFRGFFGTGRWALFGGGDAPVGVWDLSSGREAFRAKVDPFTVITLSPDGQTLALGRRDGRLSLWDIPQQRERIRLDQDLASVSAVAWSPDGRLLAWGDEAGVIVVAEGARGQDPMRYGPRIQRAIQVIAFGSDGKSLRAQDSTGLWRRYSGEPGREPEVLHSPGWNRDPDRRWSASAFLEGNGIDFRCLTYSADGAFAAGATTEGNLVIWQAPGDK